MKRKGETSVSVSLHSEKRRLEDCEKMGIYNFFQPGRQPSPGITSACIFILYLKPPELWKINFCCFSCPVCSIFLSQPEQTNTQLDYYTNTQTNTLCSRVSNKENSLSGVSCTFGQWQKFWLSRTGIMVLMVDKGRHSEIIEGFWAEEC